MEKDGKLTWIIVAAAFTILGLSIGNTYTFGVLLEPLLKEFKKGRLQTAWIGSIQPFLLYFTGIAAGPLLKKFGWRKITITGSILTAIGLFTSSIVTNMYLLYVTYGILTGIGNGLMFLTSMVCVQSNFEKYRAMATGIAVSGSGVGTLLFAIFVPKLLDKLEWRYTLVVIGVIILVLGVLCGSIYVPVREKNNNHVILPIDETNTSSGRASERKHLFSNSEVIKISIIEQTGCTSIFDCTALCDSLDFSLFGEPQFVFLSAAILLFDFAYHIPYTYMADRAIQVYGIYSDKAAMLISIMGISNVVARLLFGWIADRQCRLKGLIFGIGLYINHKTII